jgi:hypothetical protein
MRHSEKTAIPLTSFGIARRAAGDMHRITGHYVNLTSGMLKIGSAYIMQVTRHPLIFSEYVSVFEKFSIPTVLSSFNPAQPENSATVTIRSSACPMCLQFP